MIINEDMIKKEYIYVLPTVVLISLATACHKCELNDVSMANTEVATFAINTKQLSTRASATGEGFYAKYLYYGVYEQKSDGWTLMPAISATTEDRTDDQEPVLVNNYTTEVNIRLVKNKPYRIVFWAENKENSMCEIDWDTHSLITKPTLNANQEAYDAFWGKVDVEITGTHSEAVTLVRPFAQLNIGTNDLTNAVNAGLGLSASTSAIIVEGVPTTMNIIDGNVGEYTMDTSVSYISAEIPSANDWAFPIKGYEYLGLNYILSGSEQTLIDIEFSYTDEDNHNYSYEFTSVPVKRNYRTNIYGELLTGDTGYDVEVNPGFGGNTQTAEVLSIEEFKAAASDVNISSIDIKADLDFGTSSVSITTDKIINGNGYKLIAGGASSSNYGLQIVSPISVTINDLVMNGGGGIGVANGANVVINNVTLKTNYSKSGRHLFYVDNAKLTVNSGEFEVLRTGCSYFSMINSAKAYIKGGTWEDMMQNGDAPVSANSGSTLEITGGKFQVKYNNYKFDPSAYVPSGYKQERVGNYIIVTAP